MRITLQRCATGAAMGKKAAVSEELRAEVLKRFKAGESTRGLAQWLKDAHGVSVDGSTVSRWVSARAEDTTVTQALADSEAARARLVTIQQASTETLGDLDGLAAIVADLGQDAASLRQDADSIREEAHTKLKEAVEGAKTKHDLRLFDCARRLRETAIAASTTRANILCKRISLAQGAPPAPAAGPLGPSVYVPGGVDDPRRLAAEANEPLHTEGTK
jgi:hypothetical protein